MKHFVLSLFLLPLLAGIVSCNGKVKTPQVDGADSLAQADSASYSMVEQPQATIADVSLQPMKSHLIYRLVTNEYDGYDTTYNESNIELQWPSEIKNYPIEGLQKSLIKAFFGKDYNSISDAWKSVSTITDRNAKRLKSIPDDVPSMFRTESTNKGVLKRIWNNIVTYEFNTYEYEGGAHGMSTHSFFHYDLTNQAPIDPSSIFASSVQSNVLKLIEAQFMHLKGARSLSQLRDMGYDLTSVKDIPQFDFNSAQFIFIFQPYDIACYADGMPDIVIPVDKLAPYFTGLGKSLFVKPQNANM